MRTPTLTVAVRAVIIVWLSRRLNQELVDGGGRRRRVCGGPPGHVRARQTRRRASYAWLASHISELSTACTEKLSKSRMLRRMRVTSAGCAAVSSKRAKSPAA